MKEPESRGLRANLSIFEDSWQEDIVKEIRDYFNVDVSDETVELIRGKIEQVMLNSLRPKMQWEEVFQPGVKYRFVCSNCGNDEKYRTPFCPQCGAKEERQ